MNIQRRVPVLALAWIVLSCAAFAPRDGLACGEGVYNMGNGLRYQGYLAPRPAAVLVFNDAPTVPDDTKAVYRGLLQAGHRLQVARSAAQAADALRGQRFDVVIAASDQVEAIRRQLAPDAGTRILPVLPVAQRRAAGGSGQGRLFLLEGASLGQHLKLINRLLKDGA